MNSPEFVMIKVPGINGVKESNMWLYPFAIYLKVNGVICVAHYKVEEYRELVKSGTPWGSKEIRLETYGNVVIITVYVPRFLFFPRVIKYAITKGELMAHILALR